MPKFVIALPAYKAEGTLAKTIVDIPPGAADETAKLAIALTVVADPKLPVGMLGDIAMVVARPR